MVEPLVLIGTGVAAAAVAGGAAWALRRRPKPPQAVVPPHPAEAAVREAVSQAAADGVVTATERAAVDRIAADGGLDPAAAQQVYASTLATMFQRRLEEMLADGEIDPDEDASLAQLAKGLGVELAMSPATRQAVEDARTLWNIRKGRLEPTSSPVALQRGEWAYAVVQATATEVRTQTRAVAYHGPSVRFRIVRGLSYNAGLMSGGRITKEVEHPLGHGPLVITNKRLIFAGDRQAITSKLESILQIEPYADALAVMRTQGKPRLFRFDQPDPWFGMIVERARMDASG